MDWIPAFAGMTKGAAMEILEPFIKYAGGLCTVASLLGTILVLWLATKFPRRRELESVRRRLERLEAHKAANEVELQKMNGELQSISERLKGMDEKINWRFNALENEVTILLRGHMDWGNT
jgi:hypothetical protein